MYIKYLCLIVLLGLQTGCEERQIGEDDAEGGLVVIIEKIDGGETVLVREEGKRETILDGGVDRVDCQGCVERSKETGSVVVVEAGLDTESDLKMESDFVFDKDTESTAFKGIEDDTIIETETGKGWDAGQYTGLDVVVEVDSEPIIEVETDIDEKSGTDSGSAVDTGVDSEVGLDIDSEIDTGTFDTESVGNRGTESDSETDRETDSEIDNETDSETVESTDSGTVTGGNTGFDIGSESESESESVSESESESVSESESESVSEFESESVSESESESVSESESESVSEIETETDTTVPCPEFCLPPWWGDQGYEASECEEIYFNTGLTYLTVQGECSQSDYLCCTPIIIEPDTDSDTETEIGSDTGPEMDTGSDTGSETDIGTETVIETDTEIPVPDACTLRWEMACLEPGDCYGAGGEHYEDLDYYCTPYGTSFCCYREGGWSGV